MDDDRELRRRGRSATRATVPGWLCNLISIFRRRLKIDRVLKSVWKSAWKSCNCKPKMRSPDGRHVGEDDLRFENHNSEQSPPGCETGLAVVPAMPATRDAHAMLTFAGLRLASCGMSLSGRLLCCGSHVQGVQQQGHHILNKKQASGFILPMFRLKVHSKTTTATGAWKRLQTARSLFCTFQHWLYNRVLIE